MEPSRLEMVARTLQQSSRLSRKGGGVPDEEPVHIVDAKTNTFHVEGVDGAGQRLGLLHDARGLRSCRTFLQEADEVADARCRFLTIVPGSHALQIISLPAALPQAVTTVRGASALHDSATPALPAPADQREGYMASAEPVTDHQRIREWAEARNARPACVRGTGGKSDVGMIRLDFPGYTGEETLEPITWDEWFRAFDENNLALLMQEETADGKQSNFNKLVSRDTVNTR